MHTASKPSPDCRTYRTEPKGKNPQMRKTIFGGLAALALMVSATAQAAQELIVYSGRGEALIGPIITQFQRDTGITVRVRYGSTAQLATLLVEEGARTPADVFWAQDSGSLGAVAPVLAELPRDVGESIAEVFRNPANRWVPTSGRSRVLVYSTERVARDALPASIKNLTDARYRGRVAWAPTNAGFQAFVTAMRVAEGDDAARAWLRGMIANGAKTYRNNTAQIEAIANGEVDYALVNNYYLGRFTSSNPRFPAAQTAFAAGDIGNIFNAAGAGVVGASDNKEAALRFVRYLISAPAQQFITLQGNEYPVIPGVIPNATLQPYETVVQISPRIDVDRLTDLEGTLKLLREVGLL